MINLDMLHISTISLSLLFKSNFSSLWLPCIHNFMSLILLFRHVNHISSINYKLLQPNSYLYSLQILLCLLVVAVKCASFLFQKNIIICFMHSQTSSLKCLFESSCLPSLLSPLYFQDIFLIKKNYIWQDTLRKPDCRYLSWLQWGSTESQNQMIPPQAFNLLQQSSHCSYSDWNSPKVAEKEWCGTYQNHKTYMHVYIYVLAIDMYKY